MVGKRKRETINGDEPVVWHVVDVSAESEELDEGGHGRQPGKHVGDGHRHEQDVGRRSHRATEQNGADETVGDDRQ